MSELGTADSQEEKVKEYFNNRTQEWDSIYSVKDLPSIIIQQRKNHVFKYVDSLNLEKGARALDIGCGAGLTSVELLKRGHKVVAIDVSENMVDLARKNCAKLGLADNGTFEIGNVDGIDHADNSFDLVVAMGLIEYLDWDRWAVQEMHRVLKPGGHLIVTVPTKFRFHHFFSPKDLLPIIKQVLNRVFKLKGNAKHLANGEFKRTLYRSTTVKTMLTRLDFSIEKDVSHGYGPFFPLGKSGWLTLKIDEGLNFLAERKMIPFVSTMGCNYIVLGKKRIQSVEIGKRHIFENIESHLNSFESKHKELLSSRDNWISDHPEYANQEIKNFDPSAYAGENAVVLSPHPDDETIGCGGAMIKLLASDAKVTVIQMTDGNDTLSLVDAPPEIGSTIRLKEADDIAEVLQLTEQVLLKASAIGYKYEDSHAEKFLEVLERNKPKLIFVPFINDPHHAHVSANLILVEALKRSSLILDDITILSYEVWSCVPTNVFCEIDNEFDKKCEALMKFRTAMKVEDYVSNCKEINAYHSYKLFKKKGFSEVFFSLNGTEYLNLVENEMKRKD